MKDRIELFKERIWHYHAEHRRALPWRDEISPYRVVVSEIMLQQTQVDRVRDKFLAFIDSFPNFEALAHAPFVDVLRLWKGLGYNRRALALQKIAQIVVENYDNQLPTQPSLLEKMPGIGSATASSIVAFACNHPTVFIETNIRTVFIHEFFREQDGVHDRELFPLVEACVDRDRPREWYYALMDYGVMLKKTIGNVSQKSSHYHRQSRFKGSDRQIRGLMLQLLLEHPILSRNNLPSLVEGDAARIDRILDDLIREGMVRELEGGLCLP